VITSTIDGRSTTESIDLRSEEALRDSISNLFSCTIRNVALSHRRVRILNSISSSDKRARILDTHMALFLRLHRREQRVVALFHHFRLSFFCFHHLCFSRRSSAQPKGAEREKKGLRAETSFMFAKTLCRPRACIFAIIRCSWPTDTAARYPVCSRTTAERAPRLLRGCTVKSGREDCGRESRKTSPPDEEVTAKRETSPIVIGSATRYY